MRKEIEKFLNKGKEREKAIKERTEIFLDFMRSAGVNLGKLETECVEVWFKYVTHLNVSPDKRSLFLVSAWHHPYLWLDSQIKFELSGKDGTDKLIDADINQSFEINPKYVGNMNFLYSGKIIGISQIKSAQTKEQGTILNFENAEGLGFRLLPFRGGLITNFTGNR